MPPGSFETSAGNDLAAGLDDVGAGAEALTAEGRVAYPEAVAIDVFGAPPGLVAGRGVELSTFQPCTRTRIGSWMTSQDRWFWVPVPTTVSVVRYAPARAVFAGSGPGPIVGWFSIGSRDLCLARIP